ncbi:MAG: polyphosphate polymerase domain-containing protein [Bacteroidetes bacterium]|nr:polyphosphate polymerase domain-containing protein [Bacteroidota bacterium]
MKNRLEYKYLVSAAYLDKLRYDLLNYLTPDAYAVLRPGYEYTVRSIYFDSHDYKCYYEKLDGIYTRKKFRIRGYNKYEDSSQIFFEIKRKHENFISKNRARVPYAKLHKVLTDKYVDSHFADEEKMYFDYFYYYYQLRQLEPKVLVVYNREAYECKFGSQLRITFDKDLKSKAVSNIHQLYDEDGLRSAYRREFVLEIKFFQVLPQWIKNVLEKYDLTRLAISKYTSSIDIQHSSSVRANKFNRIASLKRSAA